MPPEMGRMQGFVAALLAREGALVEAIEPEGLEVLATPPVQQTLELPDLCRLGFGATLPSGARRVGLENDWLDRFGRLLGDKGRWARRVLCPEVRAPSDPERVLGHELVLDNATFRLLRVTPAWTRYLVLDFRFAAVSDEKREGVLRLSVNQATGAMPDAVLHRIAPWLDAEDGGSAPPDEDLPPAWERRRVLDLIAAALPSRLDAALAPFVKGLLRRLSRDQDRLHAYHDALHRDAMRRISTMSENDQARRREEQRVAAIGREYQAKIDDLARQYAMRVMVEWVQTLELAMPVQRFEVQIRRRKAQRVIHLDWNPLARRLEQPVCEFSRAAERPRLVCDHAMHLVTPAGLAPCANCAKPFCRACHRDECPRCGEAMHRFNLTASVLQAGLQ
ncbi:MAG: hypothetical protein M3Y41_07560 [Pseudomonadota bacterium]|nr:hypothetical protein [Pseudomonadota bacterium]